MTLRKTALNEKKPAFLQAFLNVWLHDLDSNQGPND